MSSEILLVRSVRRSIFVIAEEAHRSQYDFIDGFARHTAQRAAHASFIGFTGTPVEALWFADELRSQGGAGEP